MGLLDRFRGLAPNERAGMVLLSLADARAAIQTEREAQTALAAESVSPQLFTQGQGDGSRSGFRRITSSATKRDLTPLMQDRMQQVCYFLSVSTPFGKRIVEIITGYVIGKGFRVTAKDAAVQEVIDAFWNDEVNQMDTRLREWTDEQTRLGEVCNSVIRNPVDGSVRLGYIDPQSIDKVLFGTLTYGNSDYGIAIPTAIQLKQQLGEKKPRVLQLVRTDEDFMSGTFGKPIGDCFYFPINKASGASRGISELFSLADWIDVFDQMIFDFADKVRFLNQYIWHYVVKGGTPKQVEDLRKSVMDNPPKQGEGLFTNDRVEVEAKTPDLQGAEMNQAGEMVKKYGIGGAGLPDWFFGDSGSGNRSTADEMNGPTGKKIGSRQQYLIECLNKLVAYVVWSAQEAGTLSAKVEVSFTIEAPSIAVRDLVSGATTLQGVTLSLTTAEDRGWLRRETCARAFCTVLSEIGVEVDDPIEEFRLAQEEAADKRREDQGVLGDQGLLNDALKQIKSLPASTEVPEGAAAGA